MRLGEQIKRARQKAGLTTWELAYRTGLSKRTGRGVDAIEEGRRYPDNNARQRIGDCLGIQLPLVRAKVRTITPG
jgi:ribosome-binding protein aMBF1 (putative translation factor)